MVQLTRPALGPFAIERIVLANLECSFGDLVRHREELVRMFVQQKMVIAKNGVP